MQLCKMIEIYLKYDNMHKIGAINALICINNHVNSCINSRLSVALGHKGYRVYFGDTHHYMTSIDVTFHEDSPFFSSPSLSLTPATTSPPPSFSPLVVFHDPLPLVPLSFTSYLRSFSSCLLSSTHFLYS